MTIEDFLEILEQRDLVPQSIVRQVRTKVEKGDRRITPKSLLKYLVKKEFVTKRQAKQLLETTLTVSPNAESSILGMVPMPKVPTTDKPEAPTATPVDEGSGSLVTDESGPISGADVFGEKPSSLVSESLSAIGAAAVDPTLSQAIDEGQSDPTQPKKRSRKKKNKENEWDSSLLLLGGGGLILLIITGVVVFYLLTRENADAVLAEASAFYDGGSYTQAIKQYERFVENHTKHPEHSAATVKLGLAKLWKTSGNTTNYSQALATAQEVLPDIEDEKSFNEAQRDLASLLPKIAQGLANQAEKASENEKVQDLVKQTHSALSLCSNTKYIPTRYRDKELLSEIDLTLERVERSRAQNAALEQALTDIQAAIASRDTAKAYRIHETLIDQHPGLIKNEQLAAKILEISNAESAVVKYIAETQAASTEPRSSQVVAELALANRTGPSTGSGNDMVAVRVSGAVYGLNAANGALQWRRFIGMAPRLSPLQLPSGDFLVVNAQYDELERIAGRTGKLVWRQSFESPITRPVLFEEDVLVAETSGKLHVLNAGDGQRKGYVQFAQRLIAPPAVGAKGKRIYITGEHSSLYTLSSEDFACLGVFFLGHANGSVTTPPAVVLNKLIVAVAKGLSTSRLEVLHTTDDGIPEQRATSQRLTGLVNTDLLSQGRRLVAMTSRGQVAAYEVGPGIGKEALTPIATRDAEPGDQMARFGYLNQGTVWVAGPKLSKLTILPTSDRLPVSNIDRDYQGDTFDHPLQTSGELLIHVRRPSEKSGAIVAAMELESGQAKWETALASSPAGPAAADPAGMQLGTVTSTGLAYLVDREAMRNRVVNQAANISTRIKLPAFTQSLDLGAGRLISSAPQGKVLLHFRPGLPRNALQTIELDGPNSCAPVKWEDGFVVPARNGQVYLYTSEEGEKWGSPFQPPLQPGAVYDWLPPAIYHGDSGAQLVLSDGKNKVYLIGKAESPQPHLTATGETDVSSSPLNTRISVIGNLAVAGTEGASLAVFELPTLSPKPSIKLPSTVTWGPFTVGDYVLLATATEELICLDSSATIAWQQTMTHGPPAGIPVSLQGDLLLLWQQGGISKLNPADGSETAHAPLPQPVVAGPVPFGKRLVVSSYDGTLLVINHPE